MKQLVKSFLPQSLLNTARDVRDRMQLLSQSQSSFDLSNLKVSNDIGFEALFQDPGAQSDWEGDCKAVEDVFGRTSAADGVNPGDRRALYYLIRGLKPKKVLEIGTHVGASTLHIARALKSLGRGSVTTVDICDVNAGDGPWSRAGLKASPKDMAAQMDCDEIIEFVTQAAQDFMDQTPGRYDFIFLDGDHTAGAVYAEMARALRILNLGGVVVLHDYYPDAQPLYADGSVISGPFQALGRVRRENPDIVVHPMGDLPWPTKQGSHVTSLALVTKRQNDE